MIMINVKNNPKKILIATKNVNKFSIVSDLLKKAGLENYEFINLHDLSIEEDLEEKGSILNRAKQKADFFTEVIKKKKINDIAAVLGKDDGLILPGRKKIFSNSKETTDQILEGKIILAGEIITVASAYALNFLDKNIQKTCVIKHSYIYLGNKENIRRKEGMYVLNYVVGFLGSKKPLSAESEEECLNYYYKYSKKELNELCGLLFEK